MSKIAMIALIGTLLLGACSPAAAVGREATPEPQDSPPAAEAQAVATATPAEAGQQPTAVPVEATATMGETTGETAEEPPLAPEPPSDPTGPPPEPEPLRTPRPGLEATDPASVELASGRVQLVEFFAFW